MRIFDAHFHIIDPRFPLVPNQGYLPEPFTVDDYRSRVSVDGGAVVSASFQAYDQTYLVDALRVSGRGSWAWRRCRRRSPTTRCSLCATPACGRSG